MADDTTRAEANEETLAKRLRIGRVRNIAVVVSSAAIIPQFIIIVNYKVVFL